MDGCRAGWVVAWIHRNSLTWQVSPTLGDALALLPGSARIHVDIPIGLPEDGPRLCDGMARRFLGKRSGSVFPVPARATLAAENYAQACQLNRAATGKALSKQSWFIVPKIQEADQLLQTDPKLHSRLRESHPEVAFTALAGKPMQYRKKDDPGFEERMAVLNGIDSRASGWVEEISANTRRSAVSRDDIVDALVLALMPLAGGRARSLPPSPVHDKLGHRMTITYYA